MVEVVITAVAALLGAVLGSSGTVALTWHLKKKDEKRQRQRELLEIWRRGVDEWEREHPVTHTGARMTATLTMRSDGLPMEVITECDWYQSLRDYLQIEVDPRTRSVLALRQELHRIEKAWGLV